MTIWQTKAWWEMLKNSWQAKDIFEIDEIFVEKRKISFWKYGLFVIGLDKDITEETSLKLQALCKQEKAIFIQIETIFYDEKNSQKNFIPTEWEIYKKDSPHHPETSSGSSKKENTIYDSEINSEWQKLWIIWENIISTEVEKSFIKPNENQKQGFLSQIKNSYLRANEKRKNWQTWYYKKFIPPFTAVIDLKKSEEKIFADMKPKGRYNIRLAEKKWVECHIIEKNEKNITDFFSLMQETCSRDNFAWNTLPYYKDFLEKIQWSELISASFEWKVIASWIFVFDTEVSFYYYWASSNTYRNLMAPYLLQWTAIQEAKKRRSKIYDFLWIASPWEKNSPLTGVTEFKTKLSQDTRKLSESFIFVENKIMYFFIMRLRKLKN